MTGYFQLAEEARYKALSDKTKVGAVVTGWRFDTEKRKMFSGSNLHISDSFADIHAEQLAVSLCIIDRFYPLKIHVTSTSKKEHVLLCGSCRHFISEINHECRIVIYNPDGTIKDTKQISEVYPFAKDTRKKNKYFMKLCGYEK